MPFRYTLTGAALRHLLFNPSHHLPPTDFHLPPRSYFHSSSRALRHDHSQETDHYATLNLPPTATPGDIKKSYFRLSKLHHPDHNPTDPSSPKRFMRISEAYAVLGSAEKRARYDREVLRRPPHGNPHYHHGHGHNHHTGPAGGRPASGLSSRRRGTFTGPPPSFFKSGGWGTHGARRKQAHEESTAQKGSPEGKRPPGWTESASASSSRAETDHPDQGGMGAGQDPFKNRYDDVLHFDKEAHERTHQRVGDQRRAQRSARKKGVSLEPDTGSMWRFVMFSGVLTAAIMGGAFLSGHNEPARADNKRIARTLSSSSSL